jgi:hypothetical protein
LSRTSPAAKTTFTRRREEKVVQGTNGINLEKKKNLRPKILHLKKRHVRTRPESAGSLHLDRPRAHAYACIYPSSAGRIRAPPPPLASPCAVWTEAKRFPPIDGFSGSSTAHRGEGRLHCVVCVEASSQVVRREETENKAGKK